MNAAVGKYMVDVDQPCHSISEYNHKKLMSHDWGNFEMAGINGGYKPVVKLGVRQTVTNTLYHGFVCVCLQSVSVCKSSLFYQFTIVLSLS